MQIFVIVWYLALMLNVIDGISVTKYELKLKLNNNKLNFIFISLFEYFSESKFLFKSFKIKIKNTEIVNILSLTNFFRPTQIRGTLLCYYWNSKKVEEPWAYANLELWEEDGQKNSKNYSEI